MMMWALGWMCRAPCDSGVSWWSARVLAIRYIFALAVRATGTPAVLILCARSTRARRILWLPPRPGIPYLTLRGRFPLSTFVEIIRLSAISWLHVRVIILPHIQLGRYLLPLT